MNMTEIQEEERKEHTMALRRACLEICGITQDTCVNPCLVDDLRGVVLRAYRE